MTETAHRFFGWMSMGDPWNQIIHQSNISNAMTKLKSWYEHSTNQSKRCGMLYGPISTQIEFIYDNRSDDRFAIEQQWFQLVKSKYSRNYWRQSVAHSGTIECDSSDPASICAIVYSFGRSWPIVDESRHDKSNHFDCRTWNGTIFMRDTNRIARLRMIASNQPCLSFCTQRDFHVVIMTFHVYERRWFSNKLSVHSI